MQCEFSDLGAVLPPLVQLSPLMCGRYRLSKRKQAIEEYFETANEVEWEPRYRGCYETRGVMGEQRHL